MSTETTDRAKRKHPPCPGGCGCRLGTDDADRFECGCDGGCGGGHQDGIVCLYFGPPEECQCCGGWTKAGGGPFDGDSRFCSEECFEDAMELASRMAQRAATAWCPECGYDRQEHAPDCSASAEAAQ